MSGLLFMLGCVTAGLDQEGKGKTIPIAHTLIAPNAVGGHSDLPF